MSWLKKLFKRKEKEPEAEELPRQYIPQKKNRECFGCGMQVEEGQKYTKQMGMYFHRDCWKEQVKKSGI